MSVQAFIHALAIGSWALLLAPSIAYLLTMWKSRRDRLWDFLTEETLGPYYRLFYPSQYEARDGKDLLAHFRWRFQRRYGRRHFILPLALLAVTSGLALWGASESLIGYLTGSPRAITFDPLVVYAILGACVWIVGDQLDRLRRRDFTIHDVYGCSYRLLIAVPMGLALAAIFQEEAGPSVAFLLGAFPTQTLFKLARRTVAKRLPVDETEDKGPTELVKLQGISRGIAERFQAEGITTIAQLAWTEPVDLTIRTNFDFDFVVDCQSQALLWAYFEERTKKLIPFMMRGAMEVAEMLGPPHMGGPNLALAAPAEETIRTAAAAAEMPEGAFAQTLLEVARDPYTQILCSLWYPRWLS